MSVGGAEHFTLPAAYPRLREVNVYLGWFGRAGAAGAGGEPGRLAGRARARACGRCCRAWATAPRRSAARPRPGPGSRTSSPRRTTAAAAQLAEVQLCRRRAVRVHRRLPRLGRRARGVEGTGRARAGPGVRARGARGGLRRGRASPACRASRRGGQQRAREQVARLHAAVAATRSGARAGR